jgi:folate-dependent phosphoribosylglycinamide formyltransferase PurN
MKAILLTSTFRRHNFVANYLAQRCDLSGVWREMKTFVPERYATSPEDAEVIRRHFEARDTAEARDFADHEDVRLDNGARCRQVQGGGCSDAAEVALMQQLEPDAVLVFGTGILKGPVLAAFAGRIINIHLGLSPYYRGAGTNFWPLVNGEPEYVGATIHYLDAGIDTGPIIAHARPQMRPADGPHEIGNRAILAAAETLLEAARAHNAGHSMSRPQSRGGHLYQRKDFTADAVRRLYRNFDEGMIPRYLSEREARDARLELVELGRVA